MENSEGGALMPNDYPTQQWAGTLIRETIVVESGRRQRRTRVVGLILLVITALVSYFLFVGPLMAPGRKASLSGAASYPATAMHSPSISPPITKDGEEKQNTRTIVRPKGRVIIVAKPSGKIFVDGRPHGTVSSSKQLMLSPGEYLIEIRGKSLPLYRAQIKVHSGKTIRITHQFDSDFKDMN